MPDTAKLFRVGGSQAVRLPKQYRFEGQTTVVIRREGQRVILEPEEAAWSPEFLALAGSAPDFEEPPDPTSIEPGPDLDR